uniref:hypothetical protein n=1 Tax=Alistipes sp. TaxID=1872444 RepID=UPI004055CB2D
MKTVLEIEQEIGDVLSELRINRDLLDRLLDSRASSSGGGVKGLLRVIGRLRSRLEQLRGFKEYLTLSSSEAIKISANEISRRLRAIERTANRLDKEEKKAYLSKMEYRELKQQRANLAYLLGE